MQPSDNNVTEHVVTESDRIANRRNEVITSYDAAKAKNRRLFDDGDVNATKDYIFPNQIEDANNIANEFYVNKRRLVSVTKKTKVGADGLMIEVTKIMTTHPDDELVLNDKNVRFLTGMSNASWERDMKEKAPSCFKDKIFHHGQLQKADLANLSNALIIIDEIDTGDNEFQKLHNTLKESGLLNLDYLNENNIYFVVISATIIKELFDLSTWGDLHVNYKMTIPDTYIGHKEFLEMGIIQEFYPLNTLENANKWIEEDIVKYYGSEFRVHFARVNKKTVINIQNACRLKSNVIFYNHTSNERLLPKHLKKLFNEPLTSHVILGIKGFFRRANLIPNQWKLKIGAMHELYTTIVDNNVQIQGFPGRMTGYWKYMILAGHKTGPYRTSKKAVLEYEKAYENPFGTYSYHTDGFTRKENGKVTAKKNTMLTARNIDGLVPVDLPNIVNYKHEITGLYESSNALNSYLTSIIQVGKITKYTKSSENTIQYRGQPIKLLTYENRDQFIKLDINAGINNKLSPNNISSRMMPVFDENQTVKWIGIYTKAALEPVSQTSSVSSASSSSTL
jgi:hypothetical protein